MHIQFFLQRYMFMIFFGKINLIPLNILNSNDFVYLFYSDFEEVDGQ